MREFVFALSYDPGTNPVADVLAENPDASIRSLSCHVTEESLWRVDYATGSADALAELESAYRDATYCADCLVRDHCGADCEVQILHRCPDELVVYTYWDRTDVCTSVPHVALEELGDGIIFETYREARRYRWRLILTSDAPLSAFFDTLEDEVGACAGMEVLRLTEVDPDGSHPAQRDRLSPEQRAALDAAVEHGYYETPREIDLDTLADRLDVPRSTLSYRLRRAEATLATDFVDRESSLTPTVSHP
ncbi:helix-turn-helix domain-containing protein [Halovivax gelatinilyticus]|uniref:helix-turn-helix domain-containing protein n=1 Tax=Halovivax gelatinilyticus TaxID=2961597 RepID=UPI0020CA5ECB|nr:helix-turn-helix domain-containing protein [Halovivax gelatinilyticus]